MIDMKDVDSTFLNSKEYIALAMMNLIKDEDMEIVLRSYHCSSYENGGGVTCFGVLDEGHISIRTWL
jgi:S-adenosylmethionine/arginine decarboxylase-like enzyme